jgi:predicted nuclease of predicted toxin-antitoxin system
MRVLLDENLPHDLAALLSGHEADTVAGRGWSGVENGELLRVASGSYDAFVTMDRLLPEQQRVERLPFAVIVLLAPTNRMSHLRPLVPAILRALDTAAPGKLAVVEA